MRKIQQTYLRQLDEACPAMVYAIVVQKRGGISGRASQRGQAVHEAFGLYCEHLFRTKRKTDWDQALAIATSVLQHYPQLPFKDRREVLDQMKTIAESFLFDLDTYYGSELDLAITLEAGGEQFKVTGRPDLIDYLADESALHITDVKSFPYIPANGAVMDGDGRLADYQLQTYATLAMETMPDIQYVTGSLYMSAHGVYVPSRGHAVWTREDAQDLKDHWRNLLPPFFRGDLKDVCVPGTHCQYCPLRRPNHCKAWRSYSGNTPPPIRTYLQARRAALRVIAIEQEREVLNGHLKDYVSEHGPFQVGPTKKAETFGWHIRESEYLPPHQFQKVVQEYAADLGLAEVPEAWLSVNKRGKGFSKFRKNPAVKEALDQIAVVEKSSRFGHDSEN